MAQPDITVTPKADDAFQKAITDANEIWAVVGRGGLCFRYGPFTAEEAGPMMDKAVDEGVGMTFIIQCGKDVDWAAMRELSPASFGKNEGAGK
jgi:hypothetical protein